MKDHLELSLEDNIARGPIAENIEIKVLDQSGRGNICIEKMPWGEYRLWVEMIGFPGRSNWETFGMYPNLASAMVQLAEIIKNNCDDDFYEE